MSKQVVQHCRWQVTLHNGRARLSTDQGAVVEEVDRFLKAIAARNLSAQSVRAYAFDLLAVYRWLDQREAPEARCVAELTPGEMIEFIGFEQARGAKPSSINRRLTVLQLFFRFVTGKHIGAGGERGVNLPGPYYKGRGRDRDLGLYRLKAPAHRALRVKMPQTVVEPLTPEQARQLIGSFTRYRDLAIVYLMLLCGLRAAEVVGLGLGDVDFDEQQLRVKGKGNKERMLPLSPLLLRVLRDYLRWERPSVCKSGALFVVLQGRRRGKSMTTVGLRSLFRHRRRDPKIQNANPHRLRHTFATDMARAGVRLPILQRLLGHDDSKMSLRYINLSMADIAAEFLRAAAQIHHHYTTNEEK